MAEFRVYVSNELLLDAAEETVDKMACDILRDKLAGARKLLKSEAQE